MGTIGELTARLADAYPDAEGAATTAGDLAVLRRAFGRVGFVHLSRRDVLAQAVSWVRAEQTQQWYAGGDGEISGQISNQPTGARPTFDANAIEHHLHLIQEHQQGWEDWFSANGVSPHRVTYEELTADLTGTTTRVLQALGLEAPAQPPVARHQRQGDHVNQEWITRYRAHAHAEAQTRASAEDGAQDAPDFRGEHEKP